MIGRQEDVNLNTFTMHNPDRTQRLRAIEHQIERLARCLEMLRSQHRRYAWLRLIAFTLALLVGWAVIVLWDGRAGAIVMFLGLAGFTVIVVMQRGLGRAIEKSEILREMRLGQLARMKLDWELIPPAPSEATNRARSPLEVDLDLTGPASLQRLVDLGVSLEGSQRLASWLCCPELDLPAILGRQQAVRELSHMGRLRERLLLNLRLLTHEPLRGRRLLDWLEIRLPEGRLGFLLVLASVFTLTNGILLILDAAGKAPTLWPFSFGLYLLFYFANLKSIAPFLEAVVDLDRELEPFGSLFRFLERFSLKEGSRVAQLCAVFRDPADPPSHFLRRVKAITAAVGVRANPVAGLMLNLLSPWDFACAYLASRQRAQAVQRLPAWLDAWTELEALCGLASFAWINPDYVLPEIREEGAIFETQSLGHPLLSPEARVCNDFSLQKLGEVALITGSNMAGKSTFIKTVGINLCLAYAGGPVNARSLRTRLLRLHSCIRISDSISQGYSYFYAEVKCLQRLLEMLREDEAPPVLYLIDEIFRGTNNRERYLGSRSFVRSLAGARGSGLIATHDLELAKLEEETSAVRNLHFEDRVQKGRLEFDFLLRSGPSRSTNALKIMRLEGLPVDEDEGEGN
jgi:hypothetical protein